METVNRRQFFRTVGLGCCAHLAGLKALGLPELWASPPGRIGAASGTEPWGSYQELAPGAWAIISTPLAGERGGPAWKTLCNGGIIAGKDRVMLIESFASGEGAGWMRDLAYRLTGRFPEIAVVTHFHGDHAGGTAALQSGNAPAMVRSSQRTRELLADAQALPDPIVFDKGISRFDLGGRVVTISHQEGHTPSDLVLTLPEDGIIWGGDLLWNGIFPNFRDSKPSAQIAAVRKLRASDADTWVPGHGNIASRDDLDRYLLLLESLESAARAALSGGVDLAEAAARFTPPPGAGEWTLFSSTYYRTALEAWRRELQQDSESLGESVTVSESLA